MAKLATREDCQEIMESLAEHGVKYTGQWLCETIIALYKQLEAQAADLKKYKPDFEGCLNCGAKEPCDLDKMETANDPNWPGSPCMFEPTPRQLFDAFEAQRKRADALEAENERLRVALELAIWILDGMDTSRWGPQMLKVRAALRGEKP